MRLLCDHNVAQSYVDTFARTDWITMIEKEDVLPIDSVDPVVIDYAERHDWVVFTSDERFLRCRTHRSYHQIREKRGIKTSRIEYISECECSFSGDFPSRWRGV